MLQDQPVLFHATIAAVGLLLYLFLWRITGDLPAAARYLARMALAVVMLVPILLALLFGATTPKDGAKKQAGLQVLEADHRQAGAWPGPSETRSSGVSRSRNSPQCSA